MWALQEARIYIIISLFFLLWLLTTFFILQNTKSYTDYTTTLKTNYADIKNTTWKDKSIRDVLTINWKDLRLLPHNQLFWFSLDEDIDDIQFFDNFSVSWTSILEEVTRPLSNNNVKITLFVIDDSINLTSVDDWIDWNGVLLSNIWINFDAVWKGWTMDSNGYIWYTFKDPKKAEEIQSKYISQWVLFQNKDDNLNEKSTIIVPFISN